MTLALVYNDIKNKSIYLATDRLYHVESDVCLTQTKLIETPRFVANFSGNPSLAIFLDYIQDNHRVGSETITHLELLELHRDFISDYHNAFCLGTGDDTDTCEFVLVDKLSNKIINFTISSQSINIIPIQDLFYCHGSASVIARASYESLKPYLNTPSLIRTIFDVTSKITNISQEFDVIEVKYG